MKKMWVMSSKKLFHSEAWKGPIRQVIQPFLLSMLPLLWLPYLVLLDLISSSWPWGWWDGFSPHCENHIHHKAQFFKRYSFILFAGFPPLSKKYKVLSPISKILHNLVSLICHLLFPSGYQFYFRKEGFFDSLHWKCQVWGWGPILKAL